MEIHLSKYGEAVERLAVTASHATGGGRAAAQVLLHCYNPFDWKVDLTDLCNLDGENLEAALQVIHGRACGYEPHQVIDNGPEVLKVLWEKWDGAPFFVGEKE